MKLIYTFCCCALVLFTFKAKAQTDSTSTTDDYVITLKGDTLKCNISFPLIGASKYQLPGEVEKKLDVKTIKEYYIRRKELRKRAVYMGNDKKATFLNVIENGNISLYQIVNTRSNMSTTFYSTTSTTDWYVGKASDRVFALKTSGLYLGKSRKDRKDDFAEMLKDKPEVYDKYMAEKKFSFDAIQDMVHLYNTGQSLKPVIVSKKDDAY